MSRRALLGAMSALTLTSLGSCWPLRSLAQAETTRIVEDWGEQPVGATGVPKGWETYATPGGRPRYDFRIVLDAGRKALDMKSEDEHSTIAKKVEIDLATTPVLEWQWRAVALPAGADLRQKNRSDATGHIFVVWPRFPSLLRSRLLGYVWDEQLPVGTIVQSRKASTVRFVVVRSGHQGLGEWQTQQRDIRMDHEAAFGERPENPQVIALSIDTNDTHSFAEALFGRIALTPS